MNIHFEIDPATLVVTLSVSDAEYMRTSDIVVTGRVANQNFEHKLETRKYWSGNPCATIQELESLMSTLIRGSLHRGLWVSLRDWAKVGDDGQLVQCCDGGDLIWDYYVQDRMDKMNIQWDALLSGLSSALVKFGNDVSLKIQGQLQGTVPMEVKLTICKMQDGSVQPKVEHTTLTQVPDLVTFRVAIVAGQRQADDAEFVTIHTMPIHEDKWDARWGAKPLQAMLSKAVERGVIMGLAGAHPKTKMWPEKNSFRCDSGIFLVWEQRLTDEMAEGLDRPWWYAVLTGATDTFIRYGVDNGMFAGQIY